MLSSKALQAAEFAKHVSVRDLNRQDVFWLQVGVHDAKRNVLIALVALKVLFWVDSG